MQDLNFNKNEDHNKLLLSDLRRRFAQIKLGGGRAYNDIMEEGKALSLILKSGAIPATIQVLEERQGLKVGCLEEIAYRMKFIDKQQLIKLAEPLSKNAYGQYLLHLSQELV